MEMATMKKRRNGHSESAAANLEAARQRIAARVNLPDPPSNPYISSDPPEIVLARAVVELAAALESR